MWSAVFPGQGSQFVGMCQFLFDNFLSARRRFEEASDTLNLDFKKLCFIDPKEELSLTSFTQPALLLSSTVTYEIVKETTGISFYASSGHSIGEYAALVNAGSLNFSETLVAVRKRGEFMQSAVPLGEGSMLAVIGLDNNQVCELCRWAERESGLQPLEAANFNSPGQVVVSGTTTLIQWIQKNWAQFTPPLKKVKFIPLKVSAPFHCSLMNPAEEKMKPILESMDFKDSQYPIVQNVSAKPSQDKNELRKQLIAQISAPVLWSDCIEKLKDMGVTKCLEVGPGKTLSNLIKKIDNKTIETFNISCLEDLKELENML